MTVQTLISESIRGDGMQIRAQMCEETVQEYVDAMKAGSKFPPVVVYHDGLNYWLADGFHRMEACKRAGYSRVKAEVYEGNRIDALKFAFLANKTHGLRMSNEDKRQAVLTAYENRIDLGLGEVPSARAVGEMCGVSHVFVASQLETVTSWREATERQGSDGRTRKVPPPPPAAPPTRTTLGPRFPVPPSGGGSSGSGEKGAKGTEEPDQGIGGASLAPTSTVLSSTVLDLLGTKVPADKLEMWMRRTEILEVIKGIQKARLVVSKAQDARDALWGNFNYSSVLSHIDNALANIKGALPHCLCPYCRGIGCKACSSGLMPLVQYERLPREMKKGSEVSQ